MLNEQIYKKKIIDLIIKIFHIDKETFINVIISTFSFQDYQKDIEAIQKFTLFWKLSNEY